MSECTYAGYKREKSGSERKETNGKGYLGEKVRKKEKEELESSGAQTRRMERVKEGEKRIERERCDE